MGAYPVASLRYVRYKTQLTRACPVVLWGRFLGSSYNYTKNIWVRSSIG